MSDKDGAYVVCYLVMFIVFLIGLAVGRLL